MAEESLATEQKAFAVNMDLAKYGALAEIGAGQEVARWFFRAGGAAGTVTKTVSAYDMDVSNSFYGKTDRLWVPQRGWRKVSQGNLSGEMVDSLRPGMTHAAMPAARCAAIDTAGRGLPPR